MTDPYGQQPPSQYGPPAPFGQPTYGGPPPEGADINAIPDYKGWAIGSLFLFLIVGIFALMKSNEVAAFKLQGNYAMALDASKATKTLCLIATIVGAISCLALIAVVVVIVIAAAAVCSGSYC
ncbi:CD225/dispanin family protein [Amycolatopsis sp. cg5]|uniref:CD225/dispanin family protein n=1 Tax=Amycolatopsis sp. cg5 TaxID=3238802 RepID=UPI003523FD16